MSCSHRSRKPCVKIEAPITALKNFQCYYKTSDRDFWVLFHFQIFMCVCVFACVFYVYACIRILVIKVCCFPQLLFIFSFLPPSHPPFLRQFVTGLGAYQLASKTQRYSSVYFYRAGIADNHHCTQLFICILGICTQNFCLGTSTLLTEPSS